MVNSFKKAWLPHTDRDSISTTTTESLGLATLIAENGKAYPIADGTVVFGRSSSSLNLKNDIDLTNLDIKKIISRRHAMIQRKDNEFILHDLDSRNGTFVNGERLSSGKLYTLVSGDVIEFGASGVKLTFIR